MVPMWSFMDLCGPSCRMRTFNPRSTFWTFMQVQNVDLYKGTKIWTYAQGPNCGPMQGPKCGPIEGPWVRMSQIWPNFGPYSGTTLKWSLQKVQKWTHNQGPNFGPYSGTSCWTLDLGSKSWSLSGTIECVVP